MLSEVEKILHNGEEFAIILRNEKTIDGVEFYTKQEYPFQMGGQTREAGEEVKAHIHRPVKREITHAQEIIHLDYGKVEVEFLDENFNLISKSVLTSGDTALFVKGGHKFKFLEKTKLIEVKQGPYEGVEKDKRFKTEPSTQ